MKSRSAAIVQLRDIIITAPQELRDQLSDRKTLRGKATVCARFRPSARDLHSPSQAAKFALRSIAQRIETLDREIASLNRELEQLVAAAAPRTTQLLGISTGHAGQLLVTAGQNIDRLRGEAPTLRSGVSMAIEFSPTAATNFPAGGHFSPRWWPRISPPTDLLGFGVLGEWLDPRGNRRRSQSTDPARAIIELEPRGEALRGCLAGQRGPSPVSPSVAGSGTNRAITWSHSLGSGLK